MRHTLRILIFFQSLCCASLVSAISTATESLRKAIQKRDLAQMELALHQNANLHEEIEDLNALAQAVYIEFIPGVRYLLQWSKMHPNAGFFDPYITHILIYLLRHEDCPNSGEIVHELEQYQHYILNLPGYDYALLKAVHDNDTSLMEDMLDHNADIHFHNDACLKIAAINGKHTIVRTLLQHSLTSNKPYSSDVVEFLTKEITFIRKKIGNRKLRTMELMLWRYQLDTKK